MTFISNYPPVTESGIKGKPYITVSARGIANGLSDIPNDGADFGPDTTLNATNPSQIGAPYTQTTGIQEAWNYAFATATTNYPEENVVLPGGKPNGYWMKPILLLDGIFIVNQKVFLSPAVKIVNPKMIGSGMMSTYVYWNFNDNCIEIDHTNENFQYSNIEIGYMQPYAGSNVGAGTAFFAANYVPGDPSYHTNPFQSYDMDFSFPFNGRAMFSLTGMQQIILYNVQGYCGGTYGVLYTENSYYVAILGGILNPGSQTLYGFYANNVDSLMVYGTEFNAVSAVLANINNVYIDYCNIWKNVPFQINGNINNMYLNYVFISTNLTFLNTQSSSQVTINKLKIGYLYINAGTLTLSGSNLITINDINVENINLNSAPGSTAAISGQWVNSPTTPAVPASGTAVTNTNLYPVIVYINDGAVTNITKKTITGTSYTIYSNSTASAVYMSVRLEAGESITMTYTTAPTWTWAPA